ncbi:hypothetical protein [Halocatena salina]|uniref:Uncharacterized protein n=1 Tax=Halocatena salina TaxID=2934340 RepID=A0A8U0A7C5_9EURY|nr:hypothetical protein [Halocatena salina]UPM45025.1 hypothetical protein MW046_18385 [Halocatena salina]
MTNTSETTTTDATTDESDAASDTNEYELPVELFAGSVILTMGVLVLVTPLITTMPSDVPWDPVFVNVTSGAIYVLCGMYLVHRAA